MQTCNCSCWSHSRLPRSRPSSFESPRSICACGSAHRGRRGIVHLVPKTATRGALQQRSVTAIQTTSTSVSWLQSLVPFGKTETAKARVPTVSAEELSDLLLSLPTASETTAVVVVFSAAWCGPCKIMMERLETLGQKYASHGVQIVKIDTEESEGGSELATQLGIHKLPTIVFCGPQEGQSTIHLQGLVKQAVLQDLVLNRCQYLGNKLSQKMAW